MNTAELSRIACVSAACRLLDVEGDVYRHIEASVERLSMMDLLWLASRDISFASAIARRIVDARASSSNVVSLA